MPSGYSMTVLLYRFETGDCQSIEVSPHQATAQGLARPPRLSVRRCGFEADLGADFRDRRVTRSIQLLYGRAVVGSMKGAVFLTRVNCSTNRGIAVLSVPRFVQSYSTALIARTVRRPGPRGHFPETPHTVPNCGLVPDVLAQAPTKKGTPTPHVFVGGRCPETYDNRDK